MRGGWRRRVAWAASLLLGLAVLAVVLPPLVLRGRVLRWAVNRATAPLCGDFELGDGRLGWAVVPKLVLSRLFTVEIHDARIRAPDGTDILLAADVRAGVTIARHPWRILVDDAVVARGKWRLVDGGPPGSRFVDAFKKVPDGAGREACRERRPRAHGQSPPHAFSGGGSLLVRDLSLQDVDAELDFSAWGLKLPRVRARGSLGVGVPGSNVVLFEAHDVTAAGGSLRIARADQRGVTRATFDEVAISHVAAAPDHPTDIFLTVAGARTGRSKLSGTARFTNVFPPPGLRRSERPPSGMDLDARWTDMDDMLARLDAGWLPPGATLEQVGLGGGLKARLSGPFKALSGTVSIEGKRTRLEATIQDGRRLAADVRADGLDLAPLLAPRLHRFLDGRASGRLRADVTFASRVADTEATIDVADVSIDRAEQTLGPRRFTLHVGAPARGGVPESTADTLAVVLDRARLHAGALALEGWRVRWAALSASGRLEIALRDSRVDATVTLRLASLARWIPPSTVDARGSVNARVTGSFDHLRARIAFGRETAVAIAGERFHAPPAVTATLDGLALTVSELRFPHDGGGEVAARVRGDLGRDLGGHLEIRRYPLARVPTFAVLKPPVVLGAPIGASLADVLEGTVEAAFDVHGTLERPAATGTAALKDVRLVGRALPDGRFTVQLAPLRARVAGTLGPTLSVQGEGRALRDGAAATADLAFAEFAVSPWLPQPLSQLISTVTGRSRVSLEAGHAPHATADLRVAGPAGDMKVDGTLTATSLDGTVRGHVELAGLRPVWSPALSSAEGSLQVDLRGGLDFARIALDQVKGSIVIGRGLRAQVAGLGLDLDAAGGGRITVDGSRFQTDGLAVQTPGARAQLRGEVRLDVDAPERSVVALHAGGDLDAGGLARRVKIPMLASASGTAKFEASAKGPANAPELSGHALFSGVALRPSKPGWPPVRLDGAVQASGHTISTRGLRVQTNPHGELEIGAPTAPASVEILSFQPARLGRVDVPISARGLHFGDASTPMSVGALDLSLRLFGNPKLLTLRGDIGVANARVDSSKAKSSGSRGPSRPWYESLPPRLLLDLNVHGPKDALSVSVPVVPDVTVGFACHVSASRNGATMSGRLRGGTVYSRMAITLYDWFKPQDVRACRIFKER